MLIIGTGALASDIISSMQWDQKKENLVFFNDTDTPDFDYIKKNYQILREKEALHTYITSIDNRFIVAIGDNEMRKIICEQIEGIGGQNINYISEHAFVNNYSQLGEKGIVILGKTIVANTVKIGNGTIIYSNVNLAHQVNIEEYCLISASISISNVFIGSFSFIGIGSTIKPGIILAKNSILGIGSVLLQNTIENGIYIGNPARLFQK
jgi:sugar O-acyltransferase (sialic acid O-acetyltransferase NeuD family)